MNVILQQADKLRALQNEMPVLVKESVVENKTLIEDMNIAQLQRGEYSSGEHLRDYSPRSVREFGKRPGPITLEETGAFYRGIELEAFDDGFEMKGTDSKTQMLIDGDELHEGFGPDILGVSDPNKTVISHDILQDSLIEKSRKFLRT